MDFARKIGFVSGLASPCVFKHSTRRMWLTVHGDDLILLGSDADLDWFENKIKEEFEVKVRGRLGPGGEDLKAIRILNRIVEWTVEGLRYEADQRHAEIIVKELGIESGKVRTDIPGERLPVNEEDDAELEASSSSESAPEEDDEKRIWVSGASSSFLFSSFSSSSTCFRTFGFRRIF